jgi:hypothetical protein
LNTIFEEQKNEVSSMLLAWLLWDKSEEFFDLYIKVKENYLR